VFTQIYSKIIVGLACFILAQSAVSAQTEPDIFYGLREQMLREQIIARGIKDEEVLAAVLKVPRHKFVPPQLQKLAYHDCPLPIGYKQTISQPYIVALMSELASCSPEDRILEIGTGSGYQAAILAEIAKEVYSVEILKPLAESSRSRLKELGYENIQVNCSDGYLGWEEFAPYDAIVVTCAPEKVPPALIKQLKIGGRLVIPVGSLFQELKVYTKTETGSLEEQTIIPVRFVPMVK
jgi:protein-L-isoaspartate(D-aspartate) O-methyltransferase